MPTKENAIKPLYSLLVFAQMRPDGAWAGTDDLPSDYEACKILSTICYIYGIII